MLNGVCSITGVPPVKLVVDTIVELKGGMVTVPLNFLR
jgi:hypothetical protein